MRPARDGRGSRDRPMIVRDAGDGLAGRPPDRSRGPLRGLRARVGGSELRGTSRSCSPRSATTTAGPSGSRRRLVDADGAPVQLPGRPGARAPRLLPGLHRGRHGRGSVRRAARLDARRRHLPAALRGGPGLRLTHAAEVAALVEEFVAEQEASVPARMESAGVDDEGRWADYRRLQLYDRLSLLLLHA